MLLSRSPAVIPRVVRERRQGQDGPEPGAATSQVPAEVPREVRGRQECQQEHTAEQPGRDDTHTIRNRRTLLRLRRVVAYRLLEKAGCGCSTPTGEGVLAPLSIRRTTQPKIAEFHDLGNRRVDR